jgi:hypothetical protein
MLLCFLMTTRNHLLEFEVPCHQLSDFMKTFQQHIYLQDNIATQCFCHPKRLTFAINFQEMWTPPFSFIEKEIIYVFNNVYTYNYKGIHSHIYQEIMCTLNTTLGNDRCKIDVEIKFELNIMLVHIVYS